MAPCAWCSFDGRTYSVEVRKHRLRLCPTCYDAILAELEAAEPQTVLEMMDYLEELVDVGADLQDVPALSHAGG